MSKLHLRILDIQHNGQTDYEHSHSTLCGYVRPEVTDDAVLVDCKLCIKEIKRRYEILNVPQQPETAEDIAAAITKSNARQSEFYRKHENEPWDCED